MTICKVTFLPMDVTVEVDPSLYPYGSAGRPGSILDIALSHGVTVTHMCGGTGACGTCHVTIESGMDNLSQADEDEMDVIDRVPDNMLNTRLACEAVVGGDVVVRIPEAD